MDRQRVQCPQCNRALKVERLRAAGPALPLLLSVLIRRMSIVIADGIWIRIVRRLQAYRRVAAELAGNFCIAASVVLACRQGDDNPAEGICGRWRRRCAGGAQCRHDLQLVHIPIVVAIEIGMQRDRRQIGGVKPGWKTQVDGVKFIVSPAVPPIDICCANRAPVAQSDYGVRIVVWTVAAVQVIAAGCNQQHQLLNRARLVLRQNG